jgi:hypothetical protein
MENSQTFCESDFIAGSHDSCGKAAVRINGPHREPIHELRGDLPVALSGPIQVIQDLLVDGPQSG